MIVPNLSLAYLVSEIAPVLEGGILRKVQELENGWLKLRFQTRKGTKDVIAAPDALFITSFSIPAKQLTSGYGAFLKKKVVNKKLLSLRQNCFDRVLVMEFEGFFLVFELFAKGNVILTDKNNTILSAYRKETWKDRTLKKGEDYRFPSKQGVCTTLVNSAVLKKIFSESSLDVIRTLVKGVNIDPSLAEQACRDAVILKEENAQKIEGKRIESLSKAIASLYSVSMEREKPALVKRGNQEVLLPFPLGTGLETVKEFPSINEALDSLYSKSFEENSSKKESDAFSKRKKQMEFTMGQQKEAKKTLGEKVEQNNKKAELIYSNYAKLSALLGVVKEEVGKKTPEKDIMYKLKSGFPFLKKIELKNKKLTVSLEE